MTVDTPFLGLLDRRQQQPPLSSRKVPLKYWFLMGVEVGWLGQLIGNKPPLLTRARSRRWAVAPPTSGCAGCARSPGNSKEHSLAENHQKTGNQTQPKWTWLSADGGDVSACVRTDVYGCPSKTEDHGPKALHNIYMEKVCLHSQTLYFKLSLLFISFSHKRFFTLNADVSPLGTDKPYACLLTARLVTLNIQCG